MNEWDDIDNLQNIDTSGSLVDSHMVYFYNPNPQQGRIEATANIVFDNPILGFTADYRLFGDTNYLFAPNVTFTGQTLNGGGLLKRLRVGLLSMK